MQQAGHIARSCGPGTAQIDRLGPPGLKTPCLCSKIRKNKLAAVEIACNPSRQRCPSMYRAKRSLRAHTSEVRRANRVCIVLCTQLVSWDQQKSAGEVEWKHPDHLELGRLNRELHMFAGPGRKDSALGIREHRQCRRKATINVPPQARTSR